jgi:uncharacterized protein YggE
MATNPEGDEMTNRWKSTICRAAAATALSFAVVALAAAPRPVAATAPPTSDPAPPSAGDDGTITVSATGTVRVEPDIAVVTLGVQANAATGAEAMEQVNTSSAALTEALIAEGIAEEDIQTSGLSLWTTTDDRGEINGYQASLSVNVTIRDITVVGPTIDAAQQAAGPGFTIGGVSFSFADPESVLEQARVDAVELARTKAEQYAAAAGLTLGEVASITEHSSSPPIVYGDVAMATAEAAGPSISPGQLDLTVDVTITYSTTS